MATSCGPERLGESELSPGRLAQTPWRQARTLCLAHTCQTIISTLLPAQRWREQMF